MTDEHCCAIPSSPKPPSTWECEECGSWYWSDGVRWWKASSKTAAYVKKTVAEWPPLSDEQVVRISNLLRLGRRETALTNIDVVTASRQRTDSDAIVCADEKMSEDMVTISYSPLDGLLLLGTSRGDGSNIILKQLRGSWRWSPMLMCWYVRGSRGKKPNTLLIDLTKTALEDAGFNVEVNIMDSEPANAPVNETLEAAHPTPLTVARQAEARVAQRLEELRTRPTRKTEVGAGRMQVHLKPDGEIIVDVTDEDNQKAANFIHTLLESGVAARPLGHTEGSRTILQQMRTTPPKLGLQESIAWNYLRDNDSDDGVAVDGLRRDHDMTSKQASHALSRLAHKGFATRITHGRWRAIQPTNGVEGGE